MILPSPERAHIKAFWVVMTVMGTGMLLAASLIFGNVWTLVSSVVIGGVSLIYGLLEINMRVLWIAYKVWNKMATLTASGLQTAIIAISFFMMFTLVGRFGSTLRMNPPEARDSLWVPRQATPVGAYESLSGFPETPTRRKHWASCFVTWAAQSQNYWSWFLLPFLYVLSLLEVEQEDSVPQGIYTLY